MDRIKKSKYNLPVLQQKQLNGRNKSLCLFHYLSYFKVRITFANAVNMSVYQGWFGLGNQQTEKNYFKQTIFRHYEKAHIFSSKV